jgi:Flp pilus assembly protein TadD
MRPSDQDLRRLLIDTLVNQGVALARAERYPGAIAALGQALALDRNGVAVRHTFATALYDSGDITGALVEAGATLQLDPGHAPSHDLIGRGLALQGRYEEAVDELQRAVHLSPNDPQLQDDLRQTLAVRSASKRTRTAVR